MSDYWKCQLVGWGSMSLYWMYRLVTRSDFDVPVILLNFVLDMAIGIGLTHGYRYLATKFQWKALGLKALFVRIIPAIIFLSFVFMILNNIKWYYANVWSDSVDYPFSYYLTSWDPILITGLRMMAIWVLGYHLYHFYKREIRMAKMNAELSLAIRQAQLDNLENQLNPHFLFNSLNSIKSLVSEKPDIARRAIDLLSEILRLSLYKKDDSTIPIRKELDLVKDYVELEELRFEERLKMNIQADPAVLEHTIPPLSIQLLVENAIKHGISKRIQGGIITLSLAKQDRQIAITVENPGSLAQHGMEGGIGLENLRKRLAIQYGEQAGITIHSKEPDTVLAQLLIPIQQDENV